jgi:hypothetical protein
MSLVGLLAAAGCGSSTPSTMAPDSATAADSASKSDAPKALPDAGPTPDSNVNRDTGAPDDANSAASEAAPLAADSGATADGGSGGDAVTGDALLPLSDTASTSRDADSTESAPAGPDSAFDVGADAADAAFLPGPATAIVVNSGNTAQFGVSDGTWQLFTFDAVANQIYAVSGLSGLATGYVGTSASVSPTSYQYKTNADGVLAFTTSAAGRYYIAVASSGGGVTGSFQVADGGTLLALGSTALSLAAPDGDNTYFYRFPISAGRGYMLNATGPSQPNVGLAVSARAERSNNGQFSYSAWGVGGSLPFTNEEIPAASVAESYSGYYYFYINVKGAIALTVTITPSP